MARTLDKIACVMAAKSSADVDAVAARLADIVADRPGVVGVLACPAGLADDLDTPDGVYVVSIAEDLPLSLLLQRGVTAARSFKPDAVVIARGDAAADTILAAVECDTLAAGGAVTFGRALLCDAAAFAAVAWRLLPDESDKGLISMATGRLARRGVFVEPVTAESDGEA